MLISTKTGDGGGQNSRGCTRDLAPVGVQDSGAGQPTARHPYMLLTKRGGEEGEDGSNVGRVRVADRAHWKNRVNCKHK